MNVAFGVLGLFLFILRHCEHKAFDMEKLGFDDPARKV